MLMSLLSQNVYSGTIFRPDTHRSAFVTLLTVNPLTPSCSNTSFADYADQS